MKDDGFLAFLAVIALIAAVFFVEPTDLKLSAPQAPTIGTSRTTSSSVTPRASRHQISKPAGSLSDIEKQLKDVENRTKDLQEEIAEFETKQNQSKYYGLVQIRTLSTTKTLDASKEYIRLSASRKITNPINISGWRLVSLRDNDEVSIPFGTNLYRPNGQSIISNILLSGNENVYINTGASPISTSFKLNICSGYHEQFNDFNPRISLQCPQPDDDVVGVPDIPRNEACLDFIDRMPRCKIQTEPIEQVLGNDCNVYIYQKVNYPTCVANHIDDDKFYKNEWRIFLERRHPLWESRKETLQLLDHEGKLVDEYKN